MISPPAGCGVRSPESGLSFFRGFPVLFEPSLLVSRGCTLTPLHIFLLCKLDTFRNVWQKMHWELMFLHADSLHRTERIKWRLEFFADLGNNLADCQKVYSLSQGFARLFGLTVLSSRMISYLLLLNEHKETLDFGLGCPWHSYSILLPPHTPDSLPTPFFFSFFFQRPTALLTLHLVFTYTRKKMIFWIWCLLNQVPY